MTDTDQDFDRLSCRPDPTYTPKPDSHYREPAIERAIAGIVAEMKEADRFAHEKRIAVMAKRAGVDLPIPDRLLPSGQIVASADSLAQIERSRREGKLEEAIILARTDDQDAVNQRFYEQHGRHLTAEQKAKLPVGPREAAAKEALAQFHQAQVELEAKIAAYKRLPVVPVEEAQKALEDWLSAKAAAKREADRQERIAQAKAEAEAAASRLAALEGTP